jgi:hypothetical protein
MGSATNLYLEENAMKTTKQFLLFMLATATLLGAQVEYSIDLRGLWKFQLGDSMIWAQAEYNDAAWEEIEVPGAWENQGFAGYDGFAWLRRSIALTRFDDTFAIYLNLGLIDDVDEVYVNGKYVGGEGLMPPNFMTAYNRQRRYYIPPDILRFDTTNVIAIRIFDKHLEGGLVSGYQSLQIVEKPDNVFAQLAGIWKFRPGDDLTYARTDYDDRAWEEHILPMAWDRYGYRDYDGFAWYRRSLIADIDFSRDDVYLILGMIDDLDEVYVNGNFVAGTGNLTSDNPAAEIDDEYRRWRIYQLNEDAWHNGSENVIAIRIFDGYADGGIYRGPMVIARRDFVVALRRRENITGQDDWLKRLLIGN